MALLKSRGALLAVGLLLLPAVARLRAAAPASPQEVQAAFLCSFADFVEWPTGAPGDAVTIGILGSDPFGELLEEMARSRPLQTRPILVRRLGSVADAPECQMVFISSSEKGALPEILKTLSDASTLTVSDAPDFATRGGMIGFTIESKRVRFEINVAAAERAGLRISSRLLRLARIVGGRPESRS